MGLTAWRFDDMVLETCQNCPPPLRPLSLLHYPYLCYLFYCVHLPVFLFFIVGFVLVEWRGYRTALSSLHSIMYLEKGPRESFWRLGTYACISVASLEMLRLEPVPLRSVLISPRGRAISIRSAQISSE